MLETAASGHATFTTALALQSIYYDMFAEDDFKLTPEFTLNLGLRYECESPWTERRNQLTNFNFQAVPPLTAPGLSLHGALEFVGVNGIPREQWNPERKDLAPRLGFAYSLTPKTIIRAGAGLFYSPNFSADNPTASRGFSSQTAFVGSINGVTPVNLISDPYPQGLIYPTGSSLGLATLLVQSVEFADRHQQTPYSGAWNLDVQRQFGGNVMVSAAYVGERGLHNYATRQFNQLPDKYLSMGKALLASVPNPFYGQISSGPLSGKNATEEQLLRPYPQFESVQADASTWGSSAYNGLQLSANKRFSKGFRFTASYTWSKLMDDATGDFSGQALSGGGYYNEHRTHAGRSGHPPVTGASGDHSLANLRCYRWQKHCRGLYQTPMAA